jgi:hypothetical protein
MATDPTEFKDPTRKLFKDIRPYFDLSALPHVHAVIKAYLGLAQRFVAQHPREAFASVNTDPTTCRAVTRKGAECQRTTHSDNGYCPSHQHLAETEHGGASLAE